MKNGFIYFLLASLLLSYNSIGGYDHYEEKGIVENLLNERIVIMNDFLYGEKDSENVEKLNEKLNDIEAEELLNNDLAILYKVIDNPTDYELALNVKIDKINRLEETEKGLSINADLNWLMSGYDGEFNMIKNYDINCIESAGRVYLTALKYIE